MVPALAAPLVEGVDAPVDIDERLDMSDVRSESVVPGAVLLRVPAAGRHTISVAGSIIPTR